MTFCYYLANIETGMNLLQPNQYKKVSRSELGDIHKIGYSVRSHRRDKGMTLQQLAQATGLSIGYLSNLERNTNSPTLINVQKICEALDISFYNLLEKNKEENIIIRREDREKLISEEHNMLLENIDFGLENESFIYMTIEPHSTGDGLWWEHEYDEVGTVFTGHLAMELDNQTFELDAGDTILIKAHTRHCYFNKMDESCVSYWTRCKKEK